MPNACLVVGPAIGPFRRGQLLQIDECKPSTSMWQFPATQRITANCQTGVLMTATRPEPASRFQTDQTEWDAIANSKEFKDLMATKKDFIIAALVFFIIYYFLLPIPVGYAPNFMAIKVIGSVNIAYLFALSQFFMAWTSAWLYVRPAGDFDKLGNDIIAKAEAKSTISKGGQ